MQKICFGIALLLISFLNSYSFNIPPTSSHSGGTYNIFRSAGQDSILLHQIRKPIIWVEGFEVDQQISIQLNYNLLNQTNAEINISLANRLHTAGYDIVILNFNNPNDYIQRSAKVLEELIQTINNNKPHNEPLVIMGYSMGGLVARYALVEMENNNIDHETSLYISYDAPHKGAHVPVAVQALALTFGSSVYQQLFPQLQTVLNSFNSPAAKQMLKYKLGSGTQSSEVLAVNPDHVAFMNEINNLNSHGGFPQQCQSVALSLGSWSGIPQRANFDGDNDGQNDFQHAAFPAILINIPEGDSQGSQHVWDFNTCAFATNFGFQAFLSTTNSFSYPYYNTRSTYLGLQDYGAATFWYSNQIGLPTFPSGSWSRFWAYADGEPLDFAPGSFTNSYSQITSSLNTQVDCSFAYYDNSSFVSTVSALAFNTNDLFYRIGDDSDRLSKTPFDDIFAFCGDNRSHTAGIATSNRLVNWLMSKINNNGILNNCYCLPNVSIIGAGTVCTINTNYTLQNAPSNATVSWFVSPCNLFQTCNGTGTTATIKALNNSVQGNATLTFIAQTQCDIVTRTKTFWVGKPSIIGEIDISPSMNCNQHYIANFLGGINGSDNFTWETSNHFVKSPNGNQIGLFTEYSGEAFISIKSTNACGSSRLCTSSCISGCEVGLLVHPKANPCNIDSQCETDYFLIYPNPSSSQTKIKLKLKLDESIQKQETVMKIYDSNGNQVKERRQLSTTEWVLNDGELTKGIYQVKLWIGDMLLASKKIVIE